MANIIPKIQQYVLRCCPRHPSRPKGLKTGVLGHQLHQPADHPINIYHPEGEYLKGLVLYVE